MSRPVRRPPRRAIHLILDFDGTITTADTTALLAHLASQKAASSNPTESGAPAENQEDILAERAKSKLRLWDDIVAAYLADKKTHDEKWTSASRKAPLERTVDEEVHYQRKLEKLESRSLARVKESGLFKGMEAGDWEVGAAKMLGDGKVAVRKGLKELIERIGGKRNGGKVGVVSVNWSEQWVKGVLGAVLPKGLEVPVLCNEVDGAEGRIIGCKATNRKLITTSPHKLDTMHLLLTGFRHSSPFASVPPLIIYVGDSLTDVQCLLDADVGIIMVNGDEAAPSRVKDLFERDGGIVPHIGDLGKVARQTYGEKTRWWSRDFEEVLNSRLLRETNADDDNKDTDDEG